MTANSNFSAILQNLMTENGISQKQLAKKAELNETAIRDIIKGKSRNPRRDTLLKIAFALNCDPALMLRDKAALSPAAPDPTISLPFWGPIRPQERTALFARPPGFCSVPISGYIKEQRQNTIFVVLLENRWLDFPDNTLLACQYSGIQGQPDRPVTGSVLLGDKSDLTGMCRLDQGDNITPADRIIATVTAWNSWQEL